MYTPAYFDAVVYKYCIQASEVSKLMRNTQSISDGCFNDIVDKNISSS